MTILIYLRIKEVIKMSTFGAPPFARQVNRDMRNLKKRSKEIGIKGTTVRKATPEEIYTYNLSAKKDLECQLKKHKMGLITLDSYDVEAINNSLNKLEEYFKRWDEEHGKI